MPHTDTPSWSASLLRRDLNARAHKFAHERKLLHEIAPGPHQDTDPLIIFGRSELGPHGNFHPASDLAISANPAWLRRLAKPHTASRRSRARNEWPWRELDSAVSSDALLMNIFCHPASLQRSHPRPCRRQPPQRRPHRPTPLRHHPWRPPQHHPQRPQPNSLLNLSRPHRDRPPTRQSLPRSQTHRIQLPDRRPPPHRTLPRPRNRLRPRPSSPAKFSSLPHPIHPPKTTPSLKSPRASLTPSPSPSKPSRTVIDGYQLIRNVLAAYAADASFCVLCDARRHDLIETWYSILSAVHHPTFTTRLKLLTWQELAAVLPKDLQQFLEAKYGIVAA